MKSYIVEKDAILHNLNILLKKAGEVPLWAVLKGDGYGLGLKPMAELCLEAGVRHFAVTELSEAETLRQMAPQAQILLLRPTTDEGELTRLLEADAIATIGSLQDAAALNETCAACPDRRFCAGDSWHSWDFDKKRPRVCFKKLLWE